MARIVNGIVERRGVTRGACEIEAVRDDALAFDWDSGNLRHLGGLMSTLGLDLATALQVFLNASPERFNYLEPEDVLLEQSGRVAALDCLHMKINCGFYLPHPEIGLTPVRAEADQWIARQEADQYKGIEGRWIFDAGYFSAISDGAPRPSVKHPREDRKPPLWRTLFEPIWLRG
ncbi:MAG: hypothetical protein R3256_11320 [Thalassovita sp.]|nr:hypothetical protein [Thalassovita sp.]